MRRPKLRSFAALVITTALLCAGTAAADPPDSRSGGPPNGHHRYERYYPPPGHVVHALPRGYHVAHYGRDRYYYGGGVWYRPYGPYYSVIAPPIGIGVGFLITDVDGTPITEPFNFSTLCQNYCRATKKGRHLCHKSDSYGGRASADTQKIVIYNCLNAGLLDSAAPIFVDGLHVANVLCGQTLDSPISSAVGKERALNIGVTDTDGYLGELAKVPIISLERFQAIVKLMEVVTQTIGEMAFQKYLLYKHSRRYSEILINSVTDCIIATNTAGTISMVNDACVNILGHTRDELIGRPLESLFKPTLFGKK